LEAEPRPRSPMGIRQSRATTFLASSPGGTWMTYVTLEYMEDINTSDEPLYKLSLEGEGITLSREIPRDAALAVINVVLGGAVLPAALAQGARSAAPSRAGATTAGE